MQTSFIHEEFVNKNHYLFFIYILHQIGSGDVRTHFMRTFHDHFLGRNVHVEKRLYTLVKNYLFHLISIDKNKVSL